jgi:hypothetical protein
MSMRHPRQRPPRRKGWPPLLLLGLAVLLAAAAASASTIEGIFGGVQFTKGSVNIIERAAELAKEKRNAVVSPLHLAACMFDEDTVRAECTLKGPRPRPIHPSIHPSIHRPFPL